jgi:hypothetical protein
MQQQMPAQPQEQMQMAPAAAAARQALSVHGG